MKIGDQVAQIVTPIQGVITDTEYDKDRHELRHLVEWTDAEGQSVHRWFVESDIQQVPA